MFSKQDMKKQNSEGSPLNTSSETSGALCSFNKSHNVVAGASDTTKGFDKNVDLLGDEDNSSFSQTLLGKKGVERAESFLESLFRTPVGNVLLKEFLSL